jgi:hypothetical protein
MKENKSITHKELLTFSNLTNLDWHFANIEGTESLKSGGEETEGGTSTYIKDLLTPGLFYRVYDNGEIEYCYGSVGKGKFVESQGLIEMRQAAGIAMEYLEKWQQWVDTGGAEGTNEGEFLGDWEVIYGGDNYKHLRF